MLKTGFGVLKRSSCTKKKTLFLSVFLQPEFMKEFCHSDSWLILYYIVKNITSLFCLRLDAYIFIIINCLEMINFCKKDNQSTISMWKWLIMFPLNFPCNTATPAGVLLHIRYISVIGVNNVCAHSIDTNVVMYHREFGLNSFSRLAVILSMLNYKVSFVKAEKMFPLPFLGCSSIDDFGDCLDWLAGRTNQTGKYGWDFKFTKRDVVVST